MKQIIYTTIVMLTFCFVAFAQVKDSDKNLLQPTLIAEFNDTDNEWHKLTVYLIEMELLKNPLATGLIRIRNDKNFGRRFGLLRKAMAFQKADLSRITLLIVDEQKSDTNVLILQNCAEMPKCENCIVIRATDIDKIEKLFRPKAIRKRTKK